MANWLWLNRLLPRFFTTLLQKAQNIFLHFTISHQSLVTVSVIFNKKEIRSDYPFLCYTVPNGDLQVVQYT
jgi:hypothetical protein